MKILLETKETTKEGESYKLEKEYSDKEESKAKSEKKAGKDNYIHFHFHDENPPRPCRRVKI